MDTVKCEETSQDIVTDGSNNRNLPKIPRPLYSWDSTQEGHTIPHPHQHKEQMDITVKKEEEETYMMDYQQSEEDTLKNEESLDIGTYRSSNGNPPKICPRPLYSQDPKQEDLRTSHCDQPEEQMYIKVEVKKEEEEVGDGQQSSEASLDLGTGTLDPEEEEQSDVLSAATRPRIRGKSHIKTLRGASHTSHSHGKKRKRSVTSQTRNTRFSMEENSILIERVVEKWNELYGPLSRQISFPAKNNIWKRVVDSVNAAGVAERNIDTCKRRLSDIKRQIRSKWLELSKQRKGTGGGTPQEVTFFEYEEKLMGYIRPDLHEGVAGDNDSDLRALPKQGSTTSSSRTGAAESLNVLHNRRQMDEDSNLSFEDEETSLSPAPSVQPEEKPMIEDSSPYHVAQLDERLEEATGHSAAIENPKKKCKIVEPVNGTEKAPPAADLHQKERHPPVRTSWSKKRRPILQRRLAEATNSSNQLQDTLEKLMDSFKAQTRESRQNNSTFTDTIMHELRQTNRNLHQIAVNLAEQAAAHRNFCNQLLEEQRKISLALLVLVGNATGDGSSGGLNIPPNWLNTDNDSAT